MPEWEQEKKEKRRNARESLAVQWFGLGSGWGPGFDPGLGN